MDSYSTTLIPAGKGPDHLAVARDGSRVYVTHWSFGGDSRMVSLIDTATNGLVAGFQLNASTDFIAVSPDGARL